MVDDDIPSTVATSEEDLLRVEDLETRFFTEEGQVNAVDGVSFAVRESDVFGIVGESGSGKSVTALSLLDLVESPGRITGGHIWYRNADLAEEHRERTPEAVDGDFVDVLQLSEGQRRALRGPSFSMIFQDAMSAFNPSLTVGEQIAEAVEVQRRAEANPRSVRSKTQGYGLGSYLSGLVLPQRDFVNRQSKLEAIELLEKVGIPDPAERADEYPSQFSGGMLQRAMIAMALAGEPDVLVADEPTTALDVTIQAQILNLLKDLQAETDMSIVLITHNLGVVARMCDRVGVMYAGEIVERGTLEDVFDDPVHPYTQGLLGSVPDLDRPGDRLHPIKGNVPDLIDSHMDDRCYFADRCPKAMERCLDPPGERQVGGEHAARCVLVDGEYDESEALADGYFEGSTAGDAAASEGSTADAAAEEATSDD
ncbi:ABC transporter ATP-binding protein [Haloparvum sedimenti]|uniref:ABC transporter ATP-binding protein n=1 Tax=Haloparvum sedimenti TaxID=1678448 RepID=UPI00071E7F6B|nr:ABC transporter ATP-binding protein [Haloparvum sedimenti]